MRRTAAARVCLGCADDRSRLCARMRENDTPPEAGPLFRVGSLVRQASSQKIGRAGGSLGIVIFAPSTLASLQQGCKDVC